MAEYDYKKEWKKVYKLWKSSPLKDEDKINKPITPEFIHFEYGEEGYYIYNFNWVSNEKLKNIKTQLKINPLIDNQPQIRPSKPLVGIMMTASMLVTAKTEEEVAAVWIASICKTLLETCGKEKPISQNLKMFYDAASVFLFQNNFSVWQHYHTKAIPDYSFSYKEDWLLADTIKESTYQNKHKAMALVQGYAFAVADRHTLIEFTSLEIDDNVDLPFKRVCEIGSNFCPNKNNGENYD